MNTLQPRHCRHPLALFTLVLVVLTTSASHPSLKANAVAVQSTLDHNLNSLSLMWRSLKANAVPMQFTPTPRTTTRITVASDGSQADFFSHAGDFSADGRYLVFTSLASNLVSGDTNNKTDVFVHDQLTNSNTRVSVASDGSQANGDSNATTISADGRYIGFYSQATNLVSGDTNDTADVFVHDRTTQTTTRVSVTSAGSQSNGSSYSYWATISADGRYVAFGSSATNLVSDDTNNEPDVFLHDRETAITTRVSVLSDGSQTDFASSAPSISGDGRFVAFETFAANTSSRILVRDRVAQTTTQVSMSSSSANNDSVDASISADGRYVAFFSRDNNLVDDDTNAQDDIFVHDRESHITTRVSVASGGSQSNGNSYSPKISADGRYIAFVSSATNLVEDDTNDTADVFVHDQVSQITTRVSVASDGNQANNQSQSPTISADGRFIAFSSSATNLVSGDTNNQEDVFVHKRGETTYTYLPLVTR